MFTAALIFAALGGLLHVLFFVLESLMFMQPKVYRSFGAKDADDAESKRLFAFNQGCYNLLLAAGALVGVAFSCWGEPVVGRTLVVYCCAFMVGAALALLISAPHLKRAVLIQGGPPGLALVLLAMA